MLLGAFWGVSADLDGYGDAQLYLYYSVVFFLLMLVFNLALNFYGKFRKLPQTLSNQFFLLACSFLTGIFFFLTNYAIKYIFRSIRQPYFYSFPRNMSFIIAILLFLWISNWKHRGLKGLTIGAAGLMALSWMYITIFGGVSPGQQSASSQESPNILVITAESLRFDYLGFNGNQGIVTPHLDSLAERGVSFENYYVQAPYTTSSLSALATGCYPYEQGSRIFGQKPDPTFPTLIGELGNLGYSVDLDISYFPALFPSLSSCSYQESSILHRAFRKLRESTYIFNDYAGNIFPSLFGSYCFGSSTSMRQTSRLLQKIRLHKAKPWFFWTHFDQNCHWPYESPPQFSELYEKEGDGRAEFSLDDLHYYNAHPEAINENVLMQIQSAYRAEVSCTDRLVGMIIDQLDNLELLENTVVIFSSDHGELLGEQGFIGHGQYLDEDLIHVPLIIYAPQHFTGGRRILKMVEEVDIAPTILDLCVGASSDFGSGRSILKSMSEGWSKDSVYSEVVRDEKYFFSSFIKNGRKLVWDSTRDEFFLYDLDRDKNETRNLSQQYPNRVLELQEQMLDFLGYPNLSQLRPEIDLKIDNDMKEKMKTLGYIK